MLFRYIGAVLRKRLKLDWITDADLQHVFGVFKTNGVGHVEAGARVCFLFPHVSLMSHSCLSNLDLVSRPGARVQFVAKTDIRAGEELTWSYSNVLSQKHVVQRHLSSTWLFECRCRRCCDRSEMNLFYSSFKVVV